MDLGFVRIATLSDVLVGKMKKVTLGEKEVLIADVNGNYYAVDNLVLTMEATFRREF